MSTLEEVDAEMAGPLRTLERTEKVLKTEDNGTYSWNMPNEPSEALSEPLPEAQITPPAAPESPVAPEEPADLEAMP
jgi:hypothetical protein